MLVSVVFSTKASLGLMPPMGTKKHSTPIMRGNVVTQCNVHLRPCAPFHVKHNPHPRQDVLHVILDSGGDKIRQSKSFPTVVKQLRCNKAWVDAVDVNGTVGMGHPQTVAYFSTHHNVGKFGL